MAITLRAAGATATGTTSVVVAQPVGTVTNDVLVAFIVDHATSGSTTAPTGWTRQGGVAATAGRFQVFTAVVGYGGLTGTSWTWSSLTTKAEGIIVGYYNARILSPLDVAVSAQQNASGTVGTTSITPVTNNNMVIAAYAAYASGSTFSSDSTTSPGALTNQAYGANSTFCSIEVAGAIQATAGATGVSTVTMGTAGANAGILLALAPLSSAYTYTVSGTLALKSAGNYKATVLADSPVSYWRLDENGGTAAADQKGVNAGTYSGAYTLNQEGGLLADANQAVLLDGTSGYINVPENVSLDLVDGPLTLEAWVKRGSSSRQDTIFHKGTNAYQLRWSSTNHLILAQANGTDIVASTGTVTDTNWHYVVATKNGSAAKVYIDGVDVSGSVTVVTLVDNVGSSLRLGQASGVYYFLGCMDEVAIYNTVLTPTKVAAHYSAATTSGGVYSSTSAYAYVGGGSLPIGGTGTTGQTRIYAYTGSGSLLLSGTGTTSVSATYSYVGAGILGIAGTATTSYTSVGCIGSGVLALAGTAVTSSTALYSYTGSGSLPLAGTATSTRTTNYGFIGAGSIPVIGSATTAFTSTSSYSGSGALALAGTAVTVYFPVYSFSGSGSFSLTGAASFALGFIYVGSGSLSFTGVATTAYTPIYNYIGSGLIGGAGATGGGGSFTWIA